MGYSLLIKQGIFIGALILMSLGGMGWYYFKDMQHLQRLKKAYEDLRHDVTHLSKQFTKRHQYQNELKNFKELEQLAQERRFFSAPMAHQLQAYLHQQSHKEGVSLSKLTVQLIPSKEDSNLSAFYEVHMEGQVFPDTLLYKWLEQLEQGWGHVIIEHLVMGRARETRDLTPVDFQLKANLSYFKEKEDLS